MNISKLFEMQRVLDERIVKEKGLEGQDLLPQKILALQVELGECANEWRGFKFWSNRQTATEPEYNWKPNKDGSNLEWKPTFGYKSHPLLEEYIDCLHFALSIGLEIEPSLPTKIIEKELIHFTVMKSVLDHFMWINKKLIDLYVETRDYDHEGNAVHYLHLLNAVLGLSKALGFTWEQIEEAYLAKNQVNHERQSTGY